MWVMLGVLGLWVVAMVSALAVLLLAMRKTPAADDGDTFVNAFSKRHKP